MFLKINTHRLVNSRTYQLFEILKANRSTTNIPIISISIIENTFENYFANQAQKFIITWIERSVENVLYAFKSFPKPLFIIVNKTCVAIQMKSNHILENLHT